MAGETSSSELPFKLSSALLNDDLCSDDNSESELAIAEPYEPLVDIPTIFSSIVTAKNLVSFLQTLREGKINERGILALNLALEAVLDESKTALTEEFLLGILRLVEACCTKAETEKTQQNKEVILERQFSMTRSGSFYHYVIKQSWGKLIGYDVFSKNTHFHEASEQLLQQILQHFWSLNSGNQFTSAENMDDAERSRTGTKMTEESLKYCDKSDFDSIRDHGGWVVKRTRESILNGGSDVRAKESVDGSVVVRGDKGYAMEIIDSMGEDVKQSDGKFRFIIHESIVSFFVLLHNLVESLIDHRNLALEKGNILTNCLEKLSKNEELRGKWNSITSTTSNATSVFVLQNIVTFFVKSKQQIIREKRGLKPNKKSTAIRQQLKNSSLHISKTKQTSKEILQLRSENLSKVHITNFMESLLTYSQSVQEKMLGELTGQEVSKLLKSFGKPSLLGKKKSRQIGLLLELVKSGNISVL